MDGSSWRSADVPQRPKVGSDRLLGTWNTPVILGLFCRLCRKAVSQLRWHSEHFWEDFWVRCSGPSSICCFPVRRNEAAAAVTSDQRRVKLQTNPRGSWAHVFFFVNSFCLTQRVSLECRAVGFVNNWIICAEQNQSDRPGGHGGPARRSDWLGLQGQIQQEECVRGWLLLQWKTFFCRDAIVRIIYQWLVNEWWTSTRDLRDEFSSLLCLVVSPPVKRQERRGVFDSVRHRKHHQWLAQSPDGHHTTACKCVSATARGSLARFLALGSLCALPLFVLLSGYSGFPKACQVHWLLC